MLSLLFTSLALVFAVDAPMPASGTFIYSQTYKIESHRVDEIVDAKTPQGKIRLTELQQLSYECRFKHQFIYNCIKFLMPETAEINFITAKLSEYYNGWTLQLENNGHSPSLDYASPYYALWIGQQEAVLENKDYSFVWYTWSDGVYKLLLPNNKGKADIDFIYISEDKLSGQHLFYRQNKMITDTYFVSANLNSK